MAKVTAQRLTPVPFALQNPGASATSVDAARNVQRHRTQVPARVSGLQAIVPGIRSDIVASTFKAPAATLSAPDKSCMRYRPFSSTALVCVGDQEKNPLAKANFLQCLLEWNQLERENRAVMKDYSTFVKITAFQTRWAVFFGRPRPTSFEGFFPNFDLKKKDS